MKSSHTVALLIMLPLTPLSAQEDERATHTENPVRLDGVLDETDWNRALRLEVVTFSPIAGNEPQDPTDIRVMYDNDAIYVGAQLELANGGRTTSSSLTRDRFVADDVFRIMIDSYNDNETAFGFATNPSGIRVDFEVSGDGGGMNLDWNTFWDVATSGTESGWSVEMRIPLSSLRFQEVDGTVLMGVTASRYSAWNNERSTYPALNPSRSNPENRPSLSATVAFTNLESRSLRYVTPYLLGGLNRRSELTGGAFSDVNGEDFEAGLDAKLGIGSNLALDLTANTDFAQVEVDDVRVNLTRFSLFFPEKRQFFQERSGLFAVSTGAMMDPSLFFHSRRIGLTNQGALLRIYGGARLAGRVGEFDVGAMNMHTETGVDGTTENFGITRLRRRIVNDQSTIGASATTRMSSDGSSNVAYSLDSRIRVWGDDYLTTQWAQSFDDAITEDGFSSGMARIELERPGNLTSRGLAYRVGAKWSGPDFSPGVGFQPRRDFSYVYTNWRYGFYFSEASPLRSIQPSGVISTFLSNDGADIQSGFYALFINYELKSGVAGWLGIEANEEFLIDPLQLGDAVVTPGRYRFPQLELAVNPSQGSRARVGFEAGIGEFYDGKQVRFTISPEWNPNESLELSAEYELRRIEFDDRDQSLDADIFRLRVRTALDVHLSASAFVQYSQTSDRVVGNLRVRYHFSEGTDLYVVYRNVLNTDLERDPLLTLPRSDSQNLTVKFTRAIGI